MIFFFFCDLPLCDPHFCDSGWDGGWDGVPCDGCETDGGWDGALCDGCETYGFGCETPSNPCDGCPFLDIPCV